MSYIVHVNCSQNVLFKTVTGCRARDGDLPLTVCIRTAQRHYLEYVSSVYPHWVEQAALHREKKRIMGSNASVRTEATTRAPHPADHRTRGQGSRDKGRHTDTLVPLLLPTLPPGAAQEQGITTRTYIMYFPRAARLLLE